MDDDFRNCIDVLEKIGEKGFRSKKLRERKEFSVCAAAAVSVIGVNSDFLTPSLQ